MKNKLVKVIIANKNEEERQLLLQAVKEEMKVCGIEEAETGLDTIKLVKHYQPDLLIIDVHLTGISGLETVELIQMFDHDLKVIVTSNEVHHAITAFRLKAFYFLLKPFCLDELSSVLVRWQKEQTSKIIRKLPIEGKESIVYVHPEDVVYVAKNKEDKTVSIYTNNQFYISSYTLQQLEEKLSGYSFVRVHKSYLVNMRYIVELKTFYNGTYNLYVEGYRDEPIPVSRNYIKRLRHGLEI
ncbi:MAG TPA: LytTR family DNA-binding domain-containing protein [Bacillus sp. (in: firmicutes)]|nr:LytTR family DNA-binding domain-containing protein [Bacillus sp. (in: firmicutes)]